tara:strand:- start:44 stop:964 length:921 start_codon:yes stop_codon:yes gene_type:complete
MKQFYFLFYVALTLSLNAQTTVNYPQQTANYDATFTDGGGNFNDGPENFGMWANYDAKQSVAFRNFTESGVPGGTATTMAVGDSFTITVSATQASYGVIGLALLSSPSATASWADRINNYAVQVNLNGNDGNNDPWEVVSTAGTINSSSIGGSTSYADFVFKFTLNTATTMNVSINNDTEVFDVTLNNSNITGYSIYISDDWNGVANSNIYWKPTTEYVYATTLSNEEFNYKSTLKLYPNPANDYFKINYPTKKIIIYNSLGSSIKVFKGDFNHDFRFDLSNLDSGVYLIKILDSKNQNFKKLIIK